MSNKLQPFRKQEATVVSAPLEESVAEFVTELKTGSISDSCMSGLIAGRETEISWRLLTAHSWPESESGSTA